MCSNPVVNVEIDDSQILQIIEDSIQTYCKYSYGNGTYKDFMTISLSANVSAYQLTSAIDSVVDIEVYANTGINDLFTVQHQILYPQLMNGTLLGTGDGTIPRNNGGANSLSNYEGSMMYLKTISDYFEKKYVGQYSEGTNILRIWPTPEIDCPAMLVVWVKEKPESLYNSYHVKNLCVGKALIQWAMILSKYSIQLPGGGNLNYQVILDRGLALEEKTLENLKLESQPISFMVG